MLQIEKVIKLLDDYHFDTFREYVKNISVRSYYPLVLIDCIDRSIEVKQSTEEFCEMVYIDDDPNEEKTKKKFFQLAHYTFKLTRFLSRNYPDYLYHNISKVQRLINEGNLEKAILYLNATLDISEKIEDFNTQISTLNILALQNELQENIKDVIKMYEQQTRVITHRLSVNQMYLYRQEQFSVKSKPKTNTDIEKILGYYKPYFNSESLVVQALSRYFYLHGLNFFNVETFFDKKIFEQIEYLEKLLNNNDYLVFPYLEDLDYRVTYLKLRALIRNIDDSRVIDLASKILEDAKETHFWKNFASQPELFSIAVQASYLSSNYNTAFKENHLETLPEDISTKLNVLYNTCERLLEKDEVKNTEQKHIGITNVYSCLLLLGNNKDNKKAIDLLESLLFYYQQTPFHAYIDPIFTVIISAYFNLGNYEELENSYRYYRKKTGKITVNPENDFTIHVLFYVSKWLDTNRNQYIRKLQKLIDETPDRLRNIKLLKDLKDYYKIPIEMNKGA
ncbi:MAG: hypothetical protein AB8G11_24715 [Saprospiraceae bacterium]